MAGPSAPSPPLSLAALVVSAVLTAGCGADEPGFGGPASGDEVTAVATTPHVADLVRNVGGERVEVHQILSPGADPHDYEPRPSDAAAVAEAAVVFRSGGDLDSWLDGLLENAGDDAGVVTLGDEIDPAGGEAAAPELEADPHWWQDPRNAIAAVQAIADTLAASDPEAGPAFRQSAREYTARLERLDREIARCMRQVPEGERKLVTTHDAYGHYAARYGVEVVGALVPSRSSQAQPSAGEIDALVDQIESEGVNAIFSESPLNPELEDAVAAETGARVG
ncbi:MAG TPA: metal ABC transporter substrate-binding protein, partial [Thermoleophilaceae bacterium]|nr:metal ABC transporter substrate-binding protein [Thermoleophilaceae bacterium]